MTSFMEEQSKDLSTCCVCSYPYDEEDHQPKFLTTCLHTFCLKCIETILGKAEANCLECPVSKKFCKVPKGADSLLSNIYALHIAKLDSKSGQNWCLECDMIVKPNCLQLKHKSVSLMQEVEGIKGQLIDICTQLKESVGRREKVNEHLAQKKEKLEAKLKAIQAEMENNSNCLEKLHLMIANIQELSQLSPADKASSFVKKKVKRTSQETQDEAQQSETLLSLITSEEDKEPRSKKHCHLKRGQEAAETSIAFPLLISHQMNTNTIAPIFPPNYSSTSCRLASSTITSPSLLSSSAKNQSNGAVVMVSNPTAARETADLNSPTTNPTPSMSTPAPSLKQKRILLGIPSPAGDIKETIDITELVNQAVQKGFIVSHEPRRLTMDLDVNGRYLITAKIESQEPRVLCVTPLPPSELKSKSGITPEIL